MATLIDTSLGSFERIELIQNREYGRISSSFSSFRSIWLCEENISPVAVPVMRGPHCEPCRYFTFFSRCGWFRQFGCFGCLYVFECVDSVRDTHDVTMFFYAVVFAKQRRRQENRTPQCKQRRKSMKNAVDLASDDWRDDRVHVLGDRTLAR